MIFFSAQNSLFIINEFIPPGDTHYSNIVIVPFL
jgi:hypothetical protein